MSHDDSEVEGAMHRCISSLEYLTVRRDPPFDDVTPTLRVPVAYP